MPHWTILLLYAVVVVWVMPVALRSNVCLALLSGWALGEITVRATGDILPVSVYYLIDALVICVIIADRQLFTRLIVALFPIAWAVYALVETPRTQWYALWLIMLVQFILAGARARQGIVGDELGVVVQKRRPMDSGLSFAGEADLGADQAYAHSSLDRKLETDTRFGRGGR